MKFRRCYATELKRLLINECQEPQAKIVLIDKNWPTLNVLLKLLEGHKWQEAEVGTP